MRQPRHIGAAVGALALAASLLGAHTGTSAAATARAGSTVYADGYTFQLIASPHDPTFTQLLGINDAGTIAGYDGSGADAQHPNKGFVLTLPNTFTPENYPNSAQTQVIGINRAGDTDGFYVDSAGVVHGFTDIGGTFATVDVPGTGFNQLLGLNNRGLLAGYYGFGENFGTFEPYIQQPDQSFLLLPIADAQATSVNDTGLVGGFSVDANGNFHGFLWHVGQTFFPFFYPRSPLTVVNYPGATSTQILGVNNIGYAVGDFTDAQGVMHGFVYYWPTQRFQQIDIPGASSTTVNGLNNRGSIVGFYTDPNNNNNTIGFVGKSLGFL